MIQISGTEYRFNDFSVRVGSALQVSTFKGVVVEVLSSSSSSNEFLIVRLNTSLSSWQHRPSRCSTISWSISSLSTLVGISWLLKFCGFRWIRDRMCWMTSPSRRPILRWTRCISTWRYSMRWGNELIDYWDFSKLWFLNSKFQVIFFSRIATLKITGIFKHEVKSCEFSILHRNEQRKFINHFKTFKENFIS